MAALDIYLNLEQLKSEIIDMNERKLNEIDMAMQSSCNTVAALTAEGWAGEAREAFLENFAEHKKNMRCLVEYIQEFNRQLLAIYKAGKKLSIQGDKLANKL